MESNESLMIGPPGCGKTTWLGQRVDDAVETGRRLLVTSLTKSAAAEINARKLPISFDSLGTLHSHCYHALGQPQIAEGREHLEQWNQEQPGMELSLGAAAMSEQMDEDNLEPSYETTGDRLMNLYQILRGMMTTEEMPPKVKKFADDWQDFKDQYGLMDFTDLIETCYREVERAPGDPHVMLVDEAQDLNILEMSLIRKWGSKCETLYVVGDPDQAIFTWRGADPRAFTNSNIPEENRQVLSQSYRVPRAVHARAVRWINQMEGRERIEYRPRDHDGEVRRVLATWQDAEAIAGDLEQYLERDMTVMLLATCSYMLQPLLKVLRKNGTPFHNPFRRRNGAWNPLQRRRGQTTTADRILSFLRMSAMGAWTADDVNRWTEIVRIKGTMVKNGRKAVKELLDDENGEVGWEALMSIFTEEAVDAGLRGDLEWLETQLTAGKKAAAQFPMTIARGRGAEALTKPPMVTVGTIHCSPGDEPVLTANGWVRMEDLDPDWHKIAGHHRPSNRMTWGGTDSPSSDGFIFEKSARRHRGKLAVIKTERSRTRVTPNHRLPVSLDETFYEKWCCCLMRRGEWWRIGLCTAAHKPYRSGGVNGRLAAEQADDGWVLSIHESREEAIVAEAKWQGRYGIPGTTFRAAKNSALKDELLAETHDSVKDSVEPRVKELFQDTGLQEDQPLYTRAPLEGEAARKKTVGHIFTAAAGNLTPLSGYISVLVPQAGFLDGRERQEAIVPEQLKATVSLEEFDGIVYGLDVPPHHHYVSGGAVVHNSVKGGESDVVYVFPDVSRAGMNEWTGSPQQQESIYRLFYVAMTRARDTLVLAQPAEWNAVNLE